MFALLEVLELEATSTGRRIIDAVEVLRANRHRIGEYLPEYHQGQLTGTSFAGEAWQATLRDRRHPTRLRRRQFEVCVFAHLADELRSGDVAVAGSESYANPHTQLMSWAECEPLVAGYCAQAGIAPTAGQAIAGWKAELTAAAAAVDAGYPDNANLVIADGKPALKRRTGTERRASALALESAVHDKLPERGLLEILARTACQIGWTRHFGPALGSDPKLPDALGRYMTTAFCYGPGRDRCPRERRTPRAWHRRSATYLHRKRCRIALTRALLRRVRAS